MYYAVSKFMLDNSFLKGKTTLSQTLKLLLLENGI